MERHIPDSEFDRHFFDFGDAIRPWATFYRYLLFVSYESETQLMIGIGQKNLKAYWINGKKTSFSSNHPEYRVGTSYWCYSKEMLHETRNEVLNAGEGGFASPSLSFGRKGRGYALTVKGLDTDLTLKNGEYDFISYDLGITPFARYNAYLPFEGEIKGKKVKGIAFVQKVIHDMPFIPWRWGRTFFESGARLDFFEPRTVVPVFRALNFNDGPVSYRFRNGTRIMINKTEENPSWTLSGRTKSGETLSAKMEAYSRAQNVFATKRSTFIYNEYPARLTEFEIKKGSKTLHSLEDTGRHATNCEDAHYKKLW